jgi:hypothetical protein
VDDVAVDDTSNEQHEHQDDHSFEPFSDAIIDEDMAVVMDSLQQIIASVAHARLAIL